MSEFIPESAPLKKIISIWSKRAGSGSNRNNLFLNKTNLGTIPKRFGFVSKIISSFCFGHHHSEWTTNLTVTPAFSLISNIMILQYGQWIDKLATQGMVIGIDSIGFV
jgi:hypothetical protein